MRSNRPSIKINDLIRERIWNGHDGCQDWEDVVDMVFSHLTFAPKLTLSEKAEYLEFWFNVFIEELQSDPCNEFMLGAVIDKFANWGHPDFFSPSVNAARRALRIALIERKLTNLKNRNNES